MAFATYIPSTRAMYLRLNKEEAENIKSALYELLDPLPLDVIENTLGFENYGLLIHLKELIEDALNA